MSTTPQAEATLAFRARWLYQWQCFSVRSRGAGAGQSSVYVYVCVNGHLGRNSANFRCNYCQLPKLVFAFHIFYADSQIAAFDPQQRPNIHDSLLSRQIWNPSAATPVRCIMAPMTHTCPSLLLHCKSVSHPIVATWSAQFAANYISESVLVQVVEHLKQAPPPLLFSCLPASNQ